jgi:hypothetical protein
MTEIPSMADLVARHFTQDKTLEESAATQDGVTSEKQYYGEVTIRMTELKKLKALQENIITTMLEKSIAEDVYAKKRPHLKIVK